MEDYKLEEAQAELLRENNIQMQKYNIIYS